MSVINTTQRVGQAFRVEQWARKGVCCIPEERLAIVMHADGETPVCVHFDASIHRPTRYWGCVINSEKFVAIYWMIPSEEEVWQIARDAMIDYYEDNPDLYEGMAQSQRCLGL